VTRVSVMTILGIDWLQRKTVSGLVLAVCSLAAIHTGVREDIYQVGWFDSRVVSVLDSGTVGPGFKSQPRRCRVTVLGKLFTPIVPLFTKQ